MEPAAVWAGSTVLAAIVTTVGLLINGHNQRRSRGDITPADRLAEVTFGVGILRDQITKAERDAERWLEVETYLRDELRRTDADKERLENLLATARAQVRELTRERDELSRRLDALAAKVARGEEITLADIAGTPAGVEEDTITP